MDEEINVRSFIGKHGRDWSDPPTHFAHGSLEITIVLEGRAEFSWPDKTYLLETGHIVLIPSNVPHRFGALSTLRFGVIHIENPDLRILELFDQITGSKVKPRVISLSRLDKDQFEQLFRQWLRILSYPLKERAQNCEVWMAAILLFLLERGQSGRKALSIAGTADYIRENLHLLLQMSELASSAGLSEEGYRRLFKQTYGMTPKQYQQRCRMIEAKWQLSSSDKGLQEIAELIGFSRLHSFSLWFKSMEGVSPSDWRKQQKLNFE